MKRSKGFTLIEVLVVVAILGILVATVVPNLVQFIGRGEVAARAAELASVQTAMDAMMTDKRVTTVTAVTTATNDMKSFPDSTNPLSDYLRGDVTEYKYTCQDNGQVEGE